VGRKRNGEERFYIRKYIWRVIKKLANGKQIQNVTFVIFGAPCTGKTTLKGRLVEAGLKVIDMDDFVFPKYREDFIATGYNIDQFAKDDPVRWKSIQHEWNNAASDADVAVIWPSWTRAGLLEIDADVGFGLTRDVTDWRDCVQKHRDHDLSNRMKESTPEEWNWAHVEWMPADLFCMGDIDIAFSTIREIVRRGGIHG
jgi:hypothetical protein